MTKIYQGMTVGTQKRSEYQKKVASYQPRRSIQLKAERTAKHAELLRDRLSTVLRETYSSGSSGPFAKFLQDLERFSQEAVKNPHLPFDGKYEMKAQPSMLSAFVAGSVPDADTRINAEGFALITQQE